ncbi:MAG: hypothetical protein AAFY20_22720, partial [Cyanobacteria bacterium J06639_14]
TKAGDAIIASSFRFVEVLALLSIFYFAIVQTLSRIARYLENQVFSYGNLPEGRGGEVMG